MAPTSRWWCSVSLLLLCSCYLVEGFYIPGVAPSEFSAGDPLEIKVSTK